MMGRGFWMVEGWCMFEINITMGVLALGSTGSPQARCITTNPILEHLSKAMGVLARRGVRPMYSIAMGKNAHRFVSPTNTILSQSKPQKAFLALVRPHVAAYDARICF